MPLHKPSLQCLRRPGQEPLSHSMISLSRNISSSSGITDLENCISPSPRTSSTPSHTKPLSIVGQHCYPFFRDHLHNPYPTLQDKERVVKEANHADVTLLSVSNWFANSRRRSGWIELCNEYYNGDTKRMVEICTHVISGRGEARSSDPPEIVDKILDMENKVRTWHEQRTEPSHWALALHDLISNFTKKLQLTLDASTEEYLCPPAPPQNEEFTINTGTKRSLADYLSDAADSPALTRSPSFSSISTSSSENYFSEEYVNDEMARSPKRGRFTIEGNVDEAVSRSPSMTINENFLQKNTLQRKRCFSDFSDSGDTSNTSVPSKRLRTMKTPSEMLWQTCYTNVETPDSSQRNSVSPISTTDSNFPSSLSIIPPSVDFQSPDITWNLDIGLYDWSTFPDLQLMVDSNISTDHPRLNAQEIDLPTTDDVTLGNSEDWLQLFFPVETQKEAQESICHLSTPATNDAPTPGETSITDRAFNHEDDSLKPSLSEVPENIQTTCSEASYKPGLQGEIWDYPSGLLFSEFDNFPLDFPQAFLSQDS